MDEISGEPPGPATGPSAVRAMPRLQSPVRPGAEEPGRKSAARAAVLSLIMPGLGQIYVGSYEPGFTHALVVASLIAVLDLGVGAGESLVGFFLAFYWLFNVVDAHRKAVCSNRASDGMRLAAEGGISPDRGSLVGGAAMIGAGALLLAHTRFGCSLRWLEDWWPAALVLAGGCLVWRALAEKRSRRAGARARNASDSA